MELKFLLFTLVVLFAVFGSIETKWFGRGSSSRGSSSRGSSSRGSSSRGSSSSSRGSSSSWSSSSNRGTSGSHGSSSHNTGSFLHSERTHASSSGNRHTSSPFRPFATVPPPRHTGNSNNSPFKPFATVPPPRHTGNSNNSPFKPFATVPPPRHTGNSNNSPFKPFVTVPPPRHTGTPKPAPPPPGFILPGQTSHARPTAPPTTHFGTPAPPVLPTRHSTNFGHNNRSSGISPPSPGFNLGSNTRPTSATHPSAPVHQTHYPTQGTHPGNNHGSNPGHFNRTAGISPPAPGFNLGSNYDRTTGIHPSAPVHQTHYPTQGSNPGGSVSGTNYPRQPPFNPAYPTHTSNAAPPFYSPYPSHQPTHNYIPPGQTPQVYPQYVHTLPPNPVQTVVVVPGQSGGYHRTTGDIFKEAIIHAGVNAAVNRITSPHHHHYGSSWNNYGTPPQGQSTVTSTNTHIVNNNYYGEAPGGTGNPAGGSNSLPNNNAQSYPVSGVQDGSSNVYNPPGNTGNTGNFGNSGNYGNSGNSGNYGNSGNSGNYGNSGNSGNYGNTGNSGSSGSPGTVGPQVPSNGQSYPSQNNGNGQANNVYVEIWDQELLNITEKLFTLDENNATKFISLNLQKQIESNNTNITDTAPQPLFTIQPEAYNIPTIKAIRSLYQAASELENKTRVGNTRKEEALFIDLVLNTNVMIAAMDFLAQKNLINNDYYEHKDMLKHLWFTPYDGTSSGFKRIFQGEIWEGILWGIQDWIAFDFQEKAGRANYLSYVQKIDLGKTTPNESILKTNFEMSGTSKAGTALFVGTSPELQMALYTICYYTRPNNYCDVSLGGTQFKIYTHMDRYFGKDLINVAFPIV